METAIIAATHAPNASSARTIATPPWRENCVWFVRDIGLGCLELNHTGVTVIPSSE
jgi:hypothetical protein